MSHMDTVHDSATRALAKRVCQAAALLLSESDASPVGLGEALRRFEAALLRSTRVGDRQVLARANGNQGGGTPRKWTSNGVPGCCGQTVRLR